MKREHLHVVNNDEDDDLLPYDLWAAPAHISPQGWMAIGECIGELVMKGHLDGDGFAALHNTILKVLE